MNWAITDKGYSQRRACSLVGLDRKTYRYASRRPADEALRERLRELASERRRFGYRRLHILLRREGIEVNHKKLYRLYKEERLTVRKRGVRKRGGRKPGAGYAGTDDDPAGFEPALVSRLRVRLSGRWKAVPHSVRDRRLLTRMPGDGGGQLDLGRPRCAGARPDRGHPGLSLHGSL